MINHFMNYHFMNYHFMIYSFYGFIIKWYYLFMIYHFMVLSFYGSIFLCRTILYIHYYTRENIFSPLHFMVLSFYNFSIFIKNWKIIYLLTPLYSGLLSLGRLVETWLGSNNRRQAPFHSRRSTILDWLILRLNNYPTRRETPNLFVSLFYLYAIRTDNGDEQNESKSFVRNTDMSKPNRRITILLNYLLMINHLSFYPSIFLTIYLFIHLSF